MDKLRDNFKKIGPWLIVTFSTVILFEVLEHFAEVRAVMSNVLSVIMPFVVGAALAWLLDIPARKIEEKWVHNRGAAIAITLFGVILAVYLLGATVIPQVRDSATDFSTNISVYADNLQKLIQKTIAYTEKLPFHDKLNLENGLEMIVNDWESIWNGIKELASNYSDSIFEYGKAIGQGFASSLIAIAAMIFILIEKEHLLHTIKKLGKAVFSEKLYTEIARICTLSDKMLSGFLIGKFLDSAIIGVITAIVMSIFHMPLVALISVIVAVTNIIPVVGPIIGGGIGGVLILFVSPKSLIPFLILILVIQQVDGNIIGPKILGDNVGMPTTWTLFAIIVGGKLFGIVGMVLGVPVFAVIYTLIREFISKRLEEKGYSDMLKPTPTEQRRLERKEAKRQRLEERLKRKHKNVPVEEEYEAESEDQQELIREAACEDETLYRDSVCENEASCNAEAIHDEEESSDADKSDESSGKE